MQKNQSLVSAKQDKKSAPARESRPQPIPLDERLLKHVAGGLPKGGWQ